ncbi:UmuC protein [Streptomyces sp. NBRC 110611]|nr:UmuC protein [Streptomyces sp. NBRC 110611]
MGLTFSMALSDVLVTVMEDRLQSAPAMNSDCRPSIAICKYFGALAHSAPGGLSSDMDPPDVLSRVVSGADGFGASVANAAMGAASTAVGTMTAAAAAAVRAWRNFIKETFPRRCLSYLSCLSCQVRAHT